MEWALAVLWLVTGLVVGAGLGYVNGLRSGYSRGQRDAINVKPQTDTLNGMPALRRRTSMWDTSVKGQVGKET